METQTNEHKFDADKPLAAVADRGGRRFYDGVFHFGLSAQTEDKIMIRVEWSEVRLNEAFRVMAEKGPGAAWEFWEKSMYEVKWYPMTSDAARVAKASKLAGEQTGRRQTKTAA